MIRHLRDGTVKAYAVTFIVTLDDPEALRQSEGGGPQLVPVTVTRGLAADNPSVRWRGHYDLSRGGGLTPVGALRGPAHGAEALRHYDERMRQHVLTWARLLPHLGVEAYAQICRVLGWARVPAIEWRALARRVHAIEAREGSTHPVSHWRLPVEAWLTEEKRDRRAAWAECLDCGDPAPVGLYQCPPCHKRAREEAGM